MSNAAAARKPAVSAPLPHTGRPAVRGRHARPGDVAPIVPEIRVIAGGRLQGQGQTLPLHTRALPALQAPALQTGRLAQIRRGIRGTGYNLTGHERAFACAAGALFAAASLAAAVL